MSQYWRCTVRETTCSHKSKLFFLLYLLFGQILIWSHEERDVKTSLDVSGRDRCGRGGKVRGVGWCVRWCG